MSNPCSYTFACCLTFSKLAEASGRTLDFSRIYAARAHHSNHAGPLAGLPSLSEVESMLQLQRRSSDALARLRSAVLNQEHAIAEQQNQPRENGGVYREEPKTGGFAGGDTKKRRGVSSFLIFFVSDDNSIDIPAESRSSRPLPQLQPC